MRDITGSPFIDGCHIFPRSTYAEVSRCDLLIVPLVNGIHCIQDECLDYKKNNDGCLITRTPSERIDWLLHRIRSEKYKELFINRVCKFINIYGKSCNEVYLEILNSGYDWYIKNN